MLYLSDNKKKLSVKLKELYRYAIVYQFVSFFCTIGDANLYCITDSMNLLFGHVAVFIASVVYHFVERFFSNAYI